MKKLTAAFMAVTMLVTVTVFGNEFPMMFTSERNARGSVDGFDYEFWIQNRGEDAEMALTGGGTFDCRWGSDVFNVLFRTGRKFDRTRSYHEYDEITIDYAGEHNIRRGDVSYLTVYGWTEEPLMEFYIIESRGNYKPPGGRSIGVIDIDDGLYEIFESLRENQPSIHGTRTFPQYWSVRVGNRTEGTISVSEHFRAWEEAGLDMSGTLYEIAMCVEGFRSSGDARLTRHVLTIGDEVYGAEYDLSATASVFAEEPEETTEPDIITEPDTTPAPEEEPDETETPENTDENNDENDETIPASTVPVYIIVILICIAAIVIVTVLALREKKS